MKRVLLIVLFIALVLISGCVSTVSPVDPRNVSVSLVGMDSIKMKEFQEETFVISISNNGDIHLEDVKVDSFHPLVLIGSEHANIPGKKKDEPAPSSSIKVKVRAPGFKSPYSTATLKLTYLSGKDEKGKPIPGNKSLKIPLTLLPNAQLQYVGFVKDMEHLLEPESESTAVDKGENATITFSVKNLGETIIDGNTLRVIAEVENERMGIGGTVNISEDMARQGTSHTKGVLVRVPKDAPNGETKVFVRLIMGDNVIDEKTLTLRVNL